MRLRPGFVARSTRANRPRRGSTRTSTPSMPSARPAKPMSLSQAHEGWSALARHATTMAAIPAGSMERPALQRLLADVDAGQGRRGRRLQGRPADPLARRLRAHRRAVRRAGASLRQRHPGVQHHDSMGRLTLNVLLSFAQFEREVTGERIRDKIAASKAKGMWMGGIIPLGVRPWRPHPDRQ